MLIKNLTLVLLALNLGSSSVGYAVNHKYLKGHKLHADAAAALGITAAQHYNKAHSDYTNKVNAGKATAGKQSYGKLRYGKANY